MSDFINKDSCLLTGRIHLRPVPLIAITLILFAIIILLQWACIFLQGRAVELAKEHGKGRRNGRMDASTYGSDNWSRLSSDGECIRSKLAPFILQHCSRFAGDAIFFYIHYFSFSFVQHVFFILSSLYIYIFIIY